MIAYEDELVKEKIKKHEPCQPDSSCKALRDFYLSREDSHLFQMASLLDLNAKEDADKTASSSSCNLKSSD